MRVYWIVETHMHVGQNCQTEHHSEADALHCVKRLRERSKPDPHNPLSMVVTCWRARGDNENRIMKRVRKA